MMNQRYAETHLGAAAPASCRIARDRRSSVRCMARTHRVMQSRYAECADGCTVDMDVTQNLTQKTAWTAWRHAPGAALKDAIM